jgi:hypothetical protein
MKNMNYEHLLLALTLLSFLIGCSTRIVPIDIAKINNSNEVQQLLGKPNSIEKIEGGLEKWSYWRKSCSILALGCIRGEYYFVFTDQGEIIQKILLILDTKRRLLLPRELPEEFQDFK